MKQRPIQIISDYPLATMITTTSYGSWLPGDARGYVERGVLLTPSESLEIHAKKLLVTSPVEFSSSQQDRLFDTLCAASEEFGYRLTDASVEVWHLHWIVEHGTDSVAEMVGKLKTRMRQRLARGRIWTEGYWFQSLFTENEIGVRREYIARHEGCRMKEAVVVERAAARVC